MVYMREKTAKGTTYRQIVRCDRVEGKPRQTVLYSLGRIEERHGHGVALEAAAAILRYFEKHHGAELSEGLDTKVGGGLHGRELGSVAVIEDAWRRLGLDKILRQLGEDRRFEFSLERAAFAMVAQRLIAPGSKLACVDWLRNDVHLPSAGALDEDDLYASLSWLEEVQQTVEERLYKRLVRQGRLEPTVVFYDTTTTWFEGRGPEELAEFGRPKGGQPLHRRIILVGLVRSREGWPITHRIFPGDEADVSTVCDILTDMKARFGIKRCVFVADRGMISDDVIKVLERLKLEYVLAARMRRTKEVRDAVLARAGRFKTVRENLEVKEVQVNDRRYVVCRNPASVERDRKRREEIVATLRTKLEEGDRPESKHGMDLLRHNAFRRYLCERDRRLVVDDAKVAAEKRYDGKWVLRTNLDDETAAELALLYKEQAKIERDFRDLKSFIELRPVYHRIEPRVRAHAFICILALAVRTELESRLGKDALSLPKALKILGRVQARPLDGGGDQPIWCRPPLSAEQREILAALGLGLPQLDRMLKV